MTYIENSVSDAILSHRIGQDSMESDRRFIIQHMTDTILFEYDYRRGCAYCDPFSKDYIGFDIVDPDIKDLSWLYAATYRPHKAHMRELMDLSAVTDTCSRQTTVRILAASGEHEWFRLTLICYVSDGEKELLVITATNVDKEMRALKELEFLADSDPLTRIPNKDTFLRKVRELLDRDGKTDYMLIRLDIEHFSTFNQLFGQAEGNSLLKYVGVKIQEYMEAQTDGLYCRLESDGFAVCLSSGPAGMDEFGEYLQDTLGIYPVKFDLRLSFGCYEITDRSTPVAVMIDCAFAAQKTIKGSVIQRCAYYDEKLRAKEEATQRVSNEMRNALESGQFHIYLQPKCDIKTGEIVGSEELVRWIHPELGMVSPGEFIPVFEQNGFITELDSYILRRCCELIRSWIDRGVRVLPISVNISRTDLYNPGLFESILQTVDSYGVPHDAIEFELTESSFVTDSAPLASLNNALRKSGFRVLMDDFGSGYSSLNSLKDLQVDVLKIDLKFLPASEEDYRAYAILAAVVEMAVKLKLGIVVEGVETEEQVELLRKLNCSIVQGFFYHRPMPVEQYEQKLLEPQSQA